MNAIELQLTNKTTECEEFQSKLYETDKQINALNSQIKVLKQKQSIYQNEKTDLEQNIKNLQNKQKDSNAKITY